MEYVGKLSSLFSTVHNFYNEINPATLSGAIDIVVVEQKDGEIACSPFHVRFGKLSLLMPQEKKVVIKVNGTQIPYLMKLGEAGEAFFVFETEHDVPEEFQTSPIMGAVPESKTDEDPPYLDIGESKDQPQVDVEPPLEKKDSFEDETEAIDEKKTNKLRIPAELQSPKMIIEEQMDKVVTKIDPYQKNHDHDHLQHHHHHLSTPEQEMLQEVTEEVLPKNDLIPLEDGSALLERVIPDAITTTTIAKETFIVRPSNGDIFSTWMDVTHKAVQDREDGVDTGETKTSAIEHAHGENESIVLDIAGYKTGDSAWGKKNGSREISSDQKMVLEDMERVASPPSIEEEDHIHTNHMSRGILQSESSDKVKDEINGEIENVVKDDTKVNVKDDVKEEVKGDIKENVKDSVKEEIKEDIQNIVEEIKKDDKDDINEEPKIDIKDSVSEETKVDIEENAKDKVETDTKDDVKISDKEETKEDGKSDTEKDDKDDVKEDVKNESNEPKEEVKPVTKSSWGWGLTRRKTTGDSTTTVTPAPAATTAPSKKDEEKEEKEEKEDTTSKESLEKDGKVEMLPGETYRIEMSLCGFSAFGSDEAENAKVFEKHQITYDNFTHNPNLLNDGRLVFRYENRFYAAGRTGPLFTSLLLFRQPLAEGSQPDANQDASSDKVSDSRESYLFGKGWRKWLSRSSVAAPTATVDGEPAKEQESEDGVVPHEPASGSNTETTTFTTTTTTTSVGWTADHNHPGGDEEDNLVPRKNYAKTLRLTSDQLKSLNLKKGVNSVSFSVSSAYQGTATCAAKIFFWDHDIQIVISDIDGTITKSDALGHVFTMIGKDWTHNGVAKLYTDIHNNSYHFLYLTSRAIGQADYTRDYLRKVEQNKYQLPDGPVIMSPDRLFTSLHREVIMRKPEMFKMACLKDIQRLFGGRDPFYAGFGNRITDAMSYRTVNVPASRIFTIDPNGEVKLELLQGFKSSYVHLNDLVDQIFPPINKAIDEEYSDWNYWKAPLPEIDLPELDLPPTSPKPKPIVPDPSVLPPSSVASVPERQSRGILRSFTSRQPSVIKKPQIVSSASTPTKLSSPVLEAEKTPEGSIADTSDRESIRSTPGNTSPVSSSIMNKVISGSLGGVRNTLSRTFLSEPPKQDVVEDEEAEFDPELDALDDDLDMESIPFI